MKTITFYWEGEPPKSTFQQRNKNFRKTASARLAFAQWQAILEKYVPAKPLAGPLSFRLVISWSHTAESSRSGNPAVFKTTRPDGVNILKGVEDVMTALGYWTDDNCLSIETVERYYSEIPGVLVEIKELER